MKPYLRTGPGMPAPAGNPASSDPQPPRHW